jgi:hypothetical protein
MKMIYRYEVEIAKEPTAIVLGGDPLHIGLNEAQDKVEFWAEAMHDDPAKSRHSRKPRERIFQVFGTGMPIPDRAKYWGTTPRSFLGYVWHLFEINPAGPYRSAGGAVSELHIQPGSAPAHDDVRMIESQRRGGRT